MSHDGVIIQILSHIKRGMNAMGDRTDDHDFLWGVVLG